MPILALLTRSSPESRRCRDGRSFWLPRAGLRRRRRRRPALLLHLLDRRSFFFALIVGLMVLFVIRYRRRAGREPEPSPHHNTALELTWTVIPLAARGRHLRLRLHGLPGHARRRRRNAYEIQVTGAEVEVAVHLPERLRRREPARAGRPAGAPGHDLRGRDPQLLRPRLPREAGRRARAATRRPGSRPPSRASTTLFCAEYCGTQPLRHARPGRRAPARRASRSGSSEAGDFARRACRRPRRASSSTSARGCAQCHSRRRHGRHRPDASRASSATSVPLKAGGSAVTSTRTTSASRSSSRRPRSSPASSR